MTDKINWGGEEQKYEEYIKKREKFWSVLKLIRKEFMAETKSTSYDSYEFEEYVKEKYGIKLNFVEGNIGGTYEVVDQQKHLIFLLKF